MHISLIFYSIYSILKHYFKFLVKPLRHLTVDIVVEVHHKIYDKLHKPLVKDPEIEAALVPEKVVLE